MSKPFTVEILKEIENDLERNDITPNEEGWQYVLDRLNEIAIQWHTEQTRWIPCSERLPTKEDADENKDVLAIGRPLPFNRLKVVHYKIIGDNFCTHWRRIVKP